MFTLLLFAGTCCGGAQAAAPGKIPLIDALPPQCRGKIVLMLLGMPGCGATDKANEFLSGYAPSKPRGAEILRIDVPPPGGKLNDLPGWKAPFPRIVDEKRTIASLIDFFYYPTFYILDRKGEVRFSGECRAGDVEKMVREIASEKPGDPLHRYMAPMPAKGDKAENFTCLLQDGTTKILSGLRGKKATLLFRGSPSCPFSAEATGALSSLARNFNAAGVSIVIVSRGATGSDSKDFYSRKAPGIPVFLDEKGTISEKKFGVTTVPFFYLLDGKGVIIERRPFTDGAARTALDALLGTGSPATQMPGAG
jgi:peroxiredoxin